MRRIWIVFLLSFGMHGLPTAGGQNLDFDFLKGQPHVQIPFDLYNGFILVKVRINGIIPANFIFDTGAQHTLLFKRIYAQLLGLHFERRIPIMGSDLKRDLFALISRGVRLDWDGYLQLKQDILILEEDYFQLDEMLGTHIDGLIGGDLFKNYVVKLDYQRNLMTIYNPNHFKNPGKKFVALPLLVEDAKPYVEAVIRLEGRYEVKARLLLDTGAGVTLMLFTNTHPDLRLPDHTIKGMLGKGLGGFLEGYLGRIDYMQIGALNYPDMVTSFQDLDSSFMIKPGIGRHGILGNLVLNHYQIIIDYPGSKLYLYEVKKIKDRFYDRSGLNIFGVGDEFNEFIVNSVIEKSPAAMADIRSGDIIHKVNGLPSALFTLNLLARKFQKKAGKSYRLIILRDKQKLKKKLVLRDLI